jgi:hypothetical protein
VAEEETMIKATEEAVKVTEEEAVIWMTVAEVVKVTEEEAMIWVTAEKAIMATVEEAIKIDLVIPIKTDQTKIKRENLNMKAHL